MRFTRIALFADLTQDAAYGLRTLRRHPGFALTAIVTLALGVGVNTAVFGVVNAIVLRPLPVRDGERLVVIASQQASHRRLQGVSFPDLQDFRAATAGVFEDIAGYSVGFLGLGSSGRPAERVLVTWITGNYFTSLDLTPFRGRGIRPDEGTPGRVDPVVVLGYSAWQRRFGADPAAIGRTVMVNGRPSTIVGVVPRDFTGTFAFAEPELYLPLNWQDGGDFDSRQLRNLHAIARLRPGVTIDDAQAVIDVVAERLARQYPDSNANLRAMVVPERFARPEEDQFRTNRIGAAIVIAMVILVMLVAAVNVSSLLLAHAASRQSEFAVRAALGAGRPRLVRQVLAESLVLASLGGGAGLLLGTWTTRALTTLRLPGDLPVRFDFHLDGRVLTYGVTVALITGVLAGLVTALRVSSADLNPVLRGSGQGLQGPHSHRVRSLSVSTQSACSFVLLSLAGLFVRSLSEAQHADLGFRPEGVLNIHMDVGQLGYSEAQGRSFFDDVDRRVRAIPGVWNVSFAFTIPMGYIRVNHPVEAEGNAVDRENRTIAGKNIVSPEYFQTMGIRIVRGRPFTDADHGRSRRVAVVNQRLADLLWSGRDPIGRRFRTAGPDGPWVEVVGVTRTGKYQFLFEDPQPFHYVPIAQEYIGLRVLQVRARMSPEVIAPAVERAIRQLEPNLPLYDVQSMQQALGSGPGLFPVRVGAVAVTSLGLLAFVLAIVGLYGVLSYLISQRTREIGLRIAIGASPRDIVRLALREGWTVVSVGVAGGLLATLACSWVVGGFLFGVSAHDPLILAAVVPIVGLVGLTACAIPARRATRIDPVIALRSV
jgi:predicted permease